MKAIVFGLRQYKPTRLLQLLAEQAVLISIILTTQLIIHVDDINKQYDEARKEVLKASEVLSHTFCKDCIYCEG